ncbi:MAG: hypothetical protein AAFP70_07545 [Calditrichota bacterium]
MKTILILILLSIISVVAQDESSNNQESKSIQMELLDSRIQVLSQTSDNDKTEFIPRLNIELPVLYQPQTPQTIAYPMGDERSQTPRGKIYPSQTERDVVVNVLLSAAVQKILP